MRSKPDKLLQMARDADLLTMGIAVSGKGEVHHGHRVTLLNFLRTLSEYKDLPGYLILEDREHSYGRNETNPKLRCGVDCAVLASLQHNVNEAIAEIIRHLSPTAEDDIYRRLKISRMSDFYAEDVENRNGASGLVEAIGRASRDGLFLNYFGDVTSTSDIKQIIRPLSPDLKSTPKKMAKYEIDTDAGIIDVASCYYHDGRLRGKDIIDMSQETNWSLHYLLTGALRDVVLATRQKGQSVLHIFGGDYSAQSGTKRVRKVNRIKGLVGELITQQRGARASYYAGPLIMRNGVKVSKSLGNGDGLNIPFSELERIAHAGSGIPVELEA